MSIVVVPYLYVAEGVRPRLRRPELIGVIDHLPVEIADVADAPIVARVRDASLGNHLYMERDFEKRLGVGDALAPLVEYRVHDDSLWRPVMSWPSDMDIDQRSNAGQIGPAGRMADAEKMWRRYVVSRNYHDPEDMASFIGIFGNTVSASLEVRPYAHLAEYFEADQVPFRTSSWNDAEIRRNASIRNARHFTFIGGILHCRTPGPWWTPWANGMRLMADGPNYGPVVHSVPASSREAAERWLVENPWMTGRGPGRGPCGDVEVLDRAAFERAILPDRQCLIGQALVKISRFFLDPNSDRGQMFMPANLFSLAGRARMIETEYLLGGLPYFGLPPEAEEILAEFHNAFPLQVISGSSLRTIESPVLKEIEALEMRDRLAATWSNGTKADEPK